MNRQSVLIACCIAILLVGVIALMIMFQSTLDSRPSGGEFYAVQALEQRLDRLEQRLDDGLRAVMEQRPVVGLREMPGGATEEGGENGEVDSGESDSEDDLLGSLLARLDDLDLRIRGLEEDPIERGYSYLSSQNSELRRQGIYALERIAKLDPQARETIRQMLQDHPGDFGTH